MADTGRNEDVDPTFKHLVNFRDEIFFIKSFAIELETGLDRLASCLLEMGV